MASEARPKAREVFRPACVAGEAGNAEEELGVQQNTSVVYPTGRVALALRARRHTAQLDCSVCFGGNPVSLAERKTERIFFRRFPKATI